MPRRKFIRNNRNNKNFDHDLPFLKREAFFCFHDNIIHQGRRCIYADDNGQVG